MNTIWCNRRKRWLGLLATAAPAFLQGAEWSGSVELESRVFEYTLYGVFGSTVDVGILSELHLDSRGTHAESPFNKDIFVGGRLTWNDESDTSLVFGAFHDWETHSTSGRLEFERRLRRGFTLEIEAQLFADIDKSDTAFFPLRRDSYLQTALAWHW